MELSLVPYAKTDKSTLSKLSIDGKFECYILEDVDRGLASTMPLTEIKAKKVHGKTAIPAGRYRITITESPRFKRPLPLLLAVPGFEGIRIHPGNKAEHTEGCLLPGTDYGLDHVIGSRHAFFKLFSKLEEALKTEKVYINVER